MCLLQVGESNSQKGNWALPLSHQADLALSRALGIVLLTSNPILVYNFTKTELLVADVESTIYPQPKLDTPCATSNECYGEDVGFPGYRLISFYSRTTVD